MGASQNTGYRAPPRTSNSVGLGRSLWLCVSGNCDADAVSLQTTLKDPALKRKGPPHLSQSTDSSLIFPLLKKLKYSSQNMKFIL